MNIVSWNVNGLRSLLKSGAWETFLKMSPDIFCLQETKAEREQLSDDLLAPQGYTSFFSSSKIRKGYSGVALYVKGDDYKVTEGIGKEKFDEQGRTQTLFTKSFALINTYVPNGASKTAPLEYKLEYYNDLLLYAENIRKKKGLPVIICGDLNVAHEEIDLARPKENKKSIGFLPEERAWIDEFAGHGYVDAFRHFNPNKEGAYTYWDQKTYARERNVGWRIDYFLVTSDFLKHITTSEINEKVLGSDHCPVTLKISV